MLIISFEVSSNKKNEGKTRFTQQLLEESLQAQTEDCHHKNN
jgi:hypothetical protein